MNIVKTKEEMRALVFEHHGENQEHFDTVLKQINKWLARGDGVAVFRNEALDSSKLGHCQFVSYGSRAAQISTIMHGDGVTWNHPEKRMPDIGGAINWPYQLIAVYQGAML